MPSAFSHAVVGATLGACCLCPDTPASGRWPLLALGAACAVLPDLDVLGLVVGFGLDHPLGHRGLSHSMPFAAMLAAALVAVLPARVRREAGTWRLWTFLCLATASHGLLDALTNGGRGVAFWAPFNEARSHFPFTPIEVSPISVRAFFTRRGLEILVNELAWIWLPSALLVLVTRVVRGTLSPGSSSTLGERIRTP